MMQQCSPTYWRGMERMMPSEAPCGKHFDDFEQSTICPHDELDGPSREEIETAQLEAREEARQQHAERFPNRRT